jgi:hypothetical protein
MILETIRQCLLGLLLLGLVGTGMELILLGHDDGAWQLIPLVLIATALAVLAWHVLKPGIITIRVLEATMVCFIVAGMAGVFLHYRGSLEFQLEIDPTQSGQALFWKVMRAKAPPALAPGVMAQLGLLGLVYAYRHPAAIRSGNASFTTAGE